MESARIERKEAEKAAWKREGKKKEGKRQTRQGGKRSVEEDYSSCRGGCRVVSQWFQLNEPPEADSPPSQFLERSRKDTSSASGLIRLREMEGRGGRCRCKCKAARPRSRVNLTCWE